VRVVIDTNVFISGIFFGGPSHQILKAWESGRFTLLLSPDILAEYQRVSHELSRAYPKIDIAPILEVVALNAEIVAAPDLAAQVCEDPDDDKFLSCAEAGNADYLVTGDKLLLKVRTYAGVPIVKPRFFTDNCLK
jgi:putative PIN family toxin of toxin-antitoxin system